MQTLRGHGLYIMYLRRPNRTPYLPRMVFESSVVVQLWGNKQNFCNSTNFS